MFRSYLMCIRDMKTIFLSDWICPNCQQTSFGRVKLSFGLSRWLLITGPSGPSRLPLFGPRTRFLKSICHEAHDWRLLRVTEHSEWTESCLGFNEMSFFRSPTWFPVKDVQHHQLQLMDFRGKLVYIHQLTNMVTTLFTTLCPEKRHFIFYSESWRQNVSKWKEN